MSLPDPAVPESHTVGGFDRSGSAWVFVLFGAGGAVLGALLPLLARWASGLPWFPFQGPLELLSSFDNAWLVWGRPLLGLGAGLALAGWTLFDSPVLHISSGGIKVQRRGEVQRVIDRSKVDAIYRRGGTFVIETDGGRTLFEGDIEGDRDEIRDAFVSQGYPWEGSRE